MLSSLRSDVCSGSLGGSRSPASPELETPSVAEAERFGLLGPQGRSRFWRSPGGKRPAARASRGHRRRLIAALVFAVFLASLGQGAFDRAYGALISALVGALLFGFFFSHLLRIYHEPQGILLGAVFLLGAKGNDIVAYFCGRAFGRTRFLKVSPKKTLEGCSAAVVFSVLWFVAAGLVWPVIFFGWPASVLLGIIFSVTTQVGRPGRIADQESLRGERLVGALARIRRGLGSDRQHTVQRVFVLVRPGGELASLVKRIWVPSLVIWIWVIRIRIRIAAVRSVIVLTGQPGPPAEKD